MPLSAGTRLGPYEILSLLGQGGMGEVYRARDSKLGREVAIKVLPASLAADPDRMARFEREAQVLASLNHPHVAAIYGLEQSGGLHALVMELVEGKPLQGPLPLREAIANAIQILEALDAAHGNGITHRDLKPANILISKQGIKLLDFGLAKQSGPMQETDATLTAALTGKGQIVGTLQYMSPEQLQGKEVDSRSDLFSFGCVLYELLTGKRAFNGQSPASVIAAILEREPAPLDVVPAVERVVRRCLAKHPDQRFQTARDLATSLVWAIEQPPNTITPKPNRRWTILAAGALVLLGGIALLTSLLIWRSARAPDSHLLRFHAELGAAVVAGGNGITVAISDDGTRVAFPARAPDGNQQLATQFLDRAEAVLIPGTDGARNPFFSPDGEWIGFFAEGKMKKVSVRGGAAVPLCAAGDERGGAWAADGNIIVTLDAGTGIGLSRVPANGGPPQPLTKPAERGEATHRWPQILPGGRAVLFMGNKIASRYEDASIEVLSLKTGEVKVVQRGGYFGRYLGGYLLYVHQRTLFAVPFDVDRLEVEGTPVPLLDDMAADASIGGGQFAFSRNGTFVYLSGKRSFGVWPISWLDGTGKDQTLLAPPAEYYDMRFAPDGQRLAFSMGGEVYVYDWVRETKTRLTFTSELSDFPLWAPDGKHLIFRSTAPGAYSLKWIRADAPGEAQRLLDSKNELRPYSLSPDGKRLAYSEQSAGSGFDVWTLPLDVSDPERPKAAEPELFLRTPFDEQEPAFSPDGRWIAYVSTESGREVFVRPFPSRGMPNSPRWQISNGGGYLPIWSRKNRQLFYESLDNRIMVVNYSAKGDVFAPEKPRRWSALQLADVSPNWNLELGVDGKRFAAILNQADGTREHERAVHVTFLLNFIDEIRRRIPGRN